MWGALYNAIGIGHSVLPLQSSFRARGTKLSLVHVYFGVELIWHQMTCNVHFRSTVKSEMQRQSNTSKPTSS